VYKGLSNENMIYMEYVIIRVDQTAGIITLLFAMQMENGITSMIR
jgi:hypothetical protein